ncbi:MAG: nucleoside triphosphate pyrophosphohydrolase [Chitinophagaceae bacterium]|jgi:MazG family protein
MQHPHSFSRLQEILDELREKCPWDKKQTIHSLRQLTLEECHELADAISSDDWNGIKEELGDLLLHVLFYAKIAKEESRFDIQDVIEAIRAKLIHRHPHIYGDVKVENEDDVKRNWEKLKLKEGKKSVLSGVPRSLPPLVQAMRLQEKAKQVGFEWENKEQVWEKVEEEMKELQVEVKKQSVTTNVSETEQFKKVEEEMGDLLFSMVNYARFLGIDPDQALARTNAKFFSRFQSMEALAEKEGKKLTEMNLMEMDELWNEVKRSQQQL